MKIVGLIAALLISNLCFSQTSAVKGWVFDQRSLETIPNAVIVNSGNNQYSKSNLSGFFQIRSGNGDQRFIIAAPGYRPMIIEIDVYGESEKNIFLEPVYFDEQDSTNQIVNLHTSDISHYKLLKRQILQYKTILSISDPIKLLQFLPGVSGGFEGLSSSFVRGSNADQNLMLMNGLPVYGNGHIWGLLSNYNPEILKSTELYRGIAPARYGNRAGGGVLDVITTGGNAESWKGNVNVDLATMNFAVDGPLDKAGKWTTSLAYRRSYLDLLIQSLAPDASNSLIGNVHDFNFKLDFKESRDRHWSFWTYNGRDKYGLKFGDVITDSLGRSADIEFGWTWTWQNTLSGFSLSQKLSKDHFMHAQLGLSRYSYKNMLDANSRFTSNNGVETNEGFEHMRNAITDISLNVDFDYLIGPKSSLKYGTHWVTHHMKPGEVDVFLKTNNTVQTDTVYGTWNTNLVSEFSNYAELEFHPNPYLSLNLGGRIWSYISAEKTFLRFEPRLTINQMLEGKKRIQLGFGMNNQGIHQLSNVTGILPQDVWFPTTGMLKPQQTTQVSAAFIQPLKEGWELSIEGYYKYLSGITDVLPSRDEKLSLAYWEKSVIQGTGNSQGLEFLLTKRSGMLNSIVSYTLSSTTRLFEDLNYGDEFYFRWDRTHKVAVQLVYQQTEELSFHCNFVYMSGNPVTVPTAKFFTPDGRLVYDYSYKNNYRLPNYQRLDVGFTKEINSSNRFDYREFYGVNIYNVLGKNNVMVARFQDTNTVPGEIKLIGTGYFPFMPSAFYRIEF